MKKKKISNLGLNKSTISSFQSSSVKGGSGPSATILGETCICITLWCPTYDRSCYNLCWDNEKR